MPWPSPFRASAPRSGDFPPRDAEARQRLHRTSRVLRDPRSWHPFNWLRPVIHDWPARGGLIDADQDFATKAGVTARGQGANLHLRGNWTRGGPWRGANPVPRALDDLLTCAVSTTSGTGFDTRSNQRMGWIPPVRTMKFSQAGQVPPDDLLRTRFPTLKVRLGKI